MVGGCTGPVGLTAGTGNLGLGTSALRQESVDLSGRCSGLRSRSLCLDCRGVRAGFGGLGRRFRTECLGLSGLRSLFKGLDVELSGVDDLGALVLGNLQAFLGGLEVEANLALPEFEVELGLFEGELGILDADRVRIAGQVNGGLRGFDGELGLSEVPSCCAGLGLVVGLAGGVATDPCLLNIRLSCDDTTFGLGENRVGHDSWAVRGSAALGRVICLLGDSQAVTRCFVRLVGALIRQTDRFKVFSADWSLGEVRKRCLGDIELCLSGSELLRAGRILRLLKCEAGGFDLSLDNPDFLVTLGRLGKPDLGGLDLALK